MKMIKPLRLLLKLNPITKQITRSATNLHLNRSSHQSTSDFKNEKTDCKNRMQAWQLHSYGDEFQLTTARIPHITSPTDVLVHVEAASINPIDHMMKGGYGKTVLNFLRGYEMEFPLTLGRDFAGIVVDKGHEVGGDFKIGDKVYGIVPVQKQGSHAETVLVDISNIWQRPSDLPPIEATSILYTALTAYSALYLSGNLMFMPVRGCKVLILGASGGVGTVAVQLLKSQGAYVVGTCSTDAVPLVQSLGADNVYDYKSVDYVSNVASEGKFDIVLDCAKFGHQNLPRNWNYNKFVTLNGSLLENTDKYGLFPGLAKSAADLLCPNISVIPQGKTVRWAFFAPSQNALKFVDKLVRKGQISPTIHKVFKFSETPKAFETFAAGHLRGKIVIDFS